MRRSSSLLHVVLLLLMVGVFILQVLPSGLQKAARAAADASSSNPIARENALPGTTSWLLPVPTPSDAKNDTFDQAIEGYSSETSVKAGGTIRFAVNTVTALFTADVYRLGWYQGNGARLIESLTNIAGNAYPVPAPDPQTGLIQANWPWAFTVKTATNWVSGMYLVKLTNGNGQQSYVPFVVTSNNRSDFVFVHSASTDEAYNEWGGASLYQDLTQTLPAGRALKVSFDRPYFQNNGVGNLLYWEYQMIQWLEENSYNVSYISDVDVERNAGVLLGHHAVLLVGHSEYWSGTMRDHLEAAVAKGVNLAVFGANAIFWQIRYEPGANTRADRVIVCYKDASLDPDKISSEVTVNFRSLPVNRPEQTLLGSMYDSYFNEGSTHGFPWVVADASSWVFAGTNLKNGDSIPQVVGYEFDRVFSTYPAPATIVGKDGVNGVEVLSNSPVTDIYNNQSVSTTTLYTAPSGARVFNAGTIQWSWGLDGWGGTNAVSPAIQQITINILHNFQFNATRTR